MSNITMTTIASHLAVPAHGARSCAGTSAFAGGVDAIVRDRFTAGTRARSLIC